jgi:transposase, mutator family
MLNALSRHEHSLFVETYDGEQCNGFRPRKWQSQGLYFELRIPRIRSGAFRPMILGILKEQEEERTALFHELHVRGLPARTSVKFANASMVYSIVTPGLVRRSVYALKFVFMLPVICQHN